MELNTNHRPLETLLEAVLFYKGEPVKITVLATLLDQTTEAVEEGLRALQQSLATRGIRLVVESGYAGLATSPDTQELIETIRKEEREGPLGKAGLETLAIIMYNGPLSKADIEYIRGVNCASILRSLTMRGLIEKQENPNDKRSFLYRATPELPAYLGVESVSQMPDFAEIKEQIKVVLAEKPTEDTHE